MQRRIEISALYRLATLALLLFAARPVSAVSLHLRGLRGHVGTSASLRSRLHVNPLITAAGTVEAEFDNTYSFDDDSFNLPVLFKYTPDGTHLLWGATEFSAGVDAIASSVAEPSHRITQFSDRIVFNATSVLMDGEHFDVAAGPTVSRYLRGDRGERAGFNLIGRYDQGRSSGGFTVNWSAATDASETNPSRVLDLGGGFGRQLGTSGLLGQLTLHGNVLYERSTGLRANTSLFEGIEWQMTDKVAFDLSGQHVGVIGGTVDHQIQLAVTVNFGHWKR